MKKKILALAAIAAMALASGAYADEESSSSEEAVSSSSSVSSSSEEAISSSSVEMVCFQDSVTATTIEGKDTTVLTDGYKSFEIKTLNGKKIACIDAMSRARFQTLSIPDEVTVDSISYNRVFAVSAYATVVFPVNLTINTNVFSSFYEFNGLKKYWSGGKWVIEFKNHSGDIVANTPYIILPQVQNLNKDGSLILRKSGDGLTLKTSSDNLISVISSSDEDYTSYWQFRGTYEYKKWDANNNASELGRVYGLAAKNTTATNGQSIQAGDFVKAGNGMAVTPMHAYLYYNRVSALSKTATDSTEVLSDEDLPEVITVQFVDADGNTLTIGSMNTRTGQISMEKDAWFDMKGRKFNKKPTVKGTYYNQGKKVIIK